MQVEVLSLQTTVWRKAALIQMSGDRLEAGRSISGKILRIIFCCCTCKKNKKGKDNNEKNDFSVPIIKQNQIAPARSKEALNRLQELRKEYGAGSTEYKAALGKMHAKK